MPILNSLGALSIEEGGDNISGNLPVQKSFLKVVPSHTGNTFIIKQVRSFEIYEYSTDSGSYSLAYTIDTPTDFPTQSGVGQNILADDCDISYGGDRVLVSFYDSNQYNSKVYAYQKVGGLWTLKNSVLDAGVNRNFRFGYSVSVSWADNGCVISSYYGSNAVTGFVYYYGDIWSSTSGTVRSTLPRVSTEVNGAVKEYPFSAQITKDGSYARAATQISGVYANTDVWSITTKSGATLPLNAKWHEFSDKRNELNREFNAKILSGDKKVSFEMDAAMTYIKVTRDLVVVPVVPPAISVPVKTFTFEVGVAVNQVVATSTGVGAFSYSISPALPTGLVFNTATATITGTPTSVTGVTLYTVTVGYSGDTASDGFSLATVLPKTITAISQSLSFIIGKPVASTNLVTISGFVGTVTYSISPALPNGMVFNTATGAISGTPTVVGSVTYTVTASDSIGSRSANINVVVTSDIGLTVSNQVFTLGVNKSATIAFASGTSGPYIFSISPSLPSGISFNTTNGVISGIATAIFSGAYTILVTDKYGISKSGTVNISSSSDFSCSFNNVNYILFVSSSSRCATPSGSSAPYTYSISPALPAGLSLDTNTGMISGTPTSGLLSQSYSVTVKDKYNISVTGNITVTVSSDFSSTINTNSVGFIMGKQSSFTVATPSGSSAPYTYSISPALPAGLSLDTNTGMISGTSQTLFSTEFTLSIFDRVNIARSHKITISSISDFTAVFYNLQFKYNTSASYNVATPSGSSAPYTYSISPALPAGLSLDTNTGMISGNVNTGGISSAAYTVTITDRYGIVRTGTPVISVIGSLEVYFPTRQFVTIPTKTLFTAPAFVQALYNVGPVSHSISPALPSGLTFDIATATISGTINSSSSSYSVHTVTTRDSLREVTYNIYLNIRDYTIDAVIDENIGSSNGIAATRDGSRVAITYTDVIDGSIYGGVKVYFYDGSSYSLETTISHNLTTLGFNDCRSVDITHDGVKLVFGLISSTSGTVYLYKRSGTAWNLEQSIEQSSYTTCDFGWDVAIGWDGSTNSSTKIIVGAPHTTVSGWTNAGSIHWITYVTGRYSTTSSISKGQVLLAGKYYGSNHFGYSVDISDDGKKVIAGIPTKISGGGAYLYDANYTETTVSPPTTTGRFGYAVSMSKDGSTYAVSSLGDSVYVYPGQLKVSYSDDSYVSALVNGQSLLTNDMKSYNFGISVSVSEDGNTVIAGAPHNFINLSNGAGFIFIFKNINGSWQQINRSPSVPFRSDYFGGAVVMSNNGDTIYINSGLGSSIKPRVIRSIT
jgi:hypothetical protein